MHGSVPPSPGKRDERLPRKRKTRRYRYSIAQDKLPRVMRRKCCYAEPCKRCNPLQQRSCRSGRIGVVSTAGNVLASSGGFFLLVACWYGARYKRRFVPDCIGIGVFIIEIQTAWEACMQRRWCGVASQLFVDFLLGHQAATGTVRIVLVAARQRFFVLVMVLQIAPYVTFYSTVGRYTLITPLGAPQTGALIPVTWWSCNCLPESHFH